MKNVEGESDRNHSHRTTPMLSALTVTLILTGSLLYSLRRRSNGLIAQRPYNNRYNPAAAARDGRLER
jgi:hypothetical protein